VYLLVFGGSTGFVLQLLGLPWGSQVPDDASLYGETDQSGIFYHAGNKVRSYVLKPLLVGKHPHCEAGLAAQNITVDVIRTAMERESSNYFGDRKRTSMTGLANGAVERYHSVSMFGTMDPAHVEEVEDAMCGSSA
ncbi:Slc9a8, partial [Symbiodinium pilosum]